MRNHEAKNKAEEIRFLKKIGFLKSILTFLKILFIEKKRCWLKYHNNVMGELNFS